MKIQNNKYLQIDEVSMKITLKKLVLSCALLTLGASQVRALSVAEHVQQNGVPRIGRTLDFSNTGLTTLAGLPQVLQNSPLVRSLDLSGNNLIHIAAGDFNNAPAQLQTINLSNNQITQLPQNIFANLPNLTNLYLTNNRLPQTTVEFLNSHILPHGIALTTFEFKTPEQEQAENQQRQILAQAGHLGPQQQQQITALLQILNQLPPQNQVGSIAPAKDPNGNTLLHKALDLNNIALIRKIARIWPNLLSAQNNLGRTPLHKAAALADRNRGLIIFGELLALIPTENERLEQLEIQDNNGHTPPQVALLNNNQDIIRALQKFQAAQ